MDFLDRIRHDALVPDAASWSCCLQTGQQSTGAQVDKPGGWGVVGREEELNFPYFLLRVKVVNQRTSFLLGGAPNE